MENFSLRPASEEDLVQILNIERQAYPLPWKNEAFVDELTKPFSKFLVYTDDETDEVITAYIIYWLMFDECHILNVTVGLEWRGLGIAQKLVRQAMQDAIKKDMKRVFLEVRKSNHAAITMYQKLGFFIDHVKKSFYADGEDAFFMVLFLNQSNQF